MDFPQLMFCTSGGFKSEVLTDAGLRDDSLQFGQFIKYSADRNLTDIRQLWDNATYSAEEFAVTWATLQGKTVQTFWILETHTFFFENCFPQRMVGL